MKQGSHHEFLWRTMEMYLSHFCIIQESCWRELREVKLKPSLTDMSLLLKFSNSNPLMVSLRRADHSHSRYDHPNIPPHSGIPSKTDQWRQLWMEGRGIEVSSLCWPSERPPWPIQAVHGPHRMSQPQVFLQEWQQRLLNWGSGQSSSCRTFSQYLVLSRHSPAGEQTEATVYYTYPLHHSSPLCQWLERFLTSATGQNIASLPAVRARPPHAVMLACGLSSPTVRTGHLAWLETVPPAGGRALRPRADAPMEGTGLRGAVLQGDGPTITNTERKGSERCQKYSCEWLLHRNINTGYHLLIYSVLTPWYLYLPLDSTAHLIGDFGGIGALAVNMAVLCGQTGTHTLAVTLKEEMSSKFHTSSAFK